jgi:hypothetical protein
MVGFKNEDGTAGSPPRSTRRTLGPSLPGRGPGRRPAKRHASGTTPSQRRRRGADTEVIAKEEGDAPATLDHLGADPDPGPGRCSALFRVLRIRDGGPLEHKPPGSNDLKNIIRSPQRSQDTGKAQPRGHDRLGSEEERARPRPLPEGPWGARYITPSLPKADRSWCLGSDGQPGGAGEAADSVFLNRSVPVGAR